MQINSVGKVDAVWCSMKRRMCEYANIMGGCTFVGNCQYPEGETVSVTVNSSMHSSPFIEVHPLPDELIINGTKYKKVIE